MAIQFDFSKTPDDPNKLQSGGEGRPSPGKGMVKILKFTEYGGANKQAHELEFEIVAWSNKDDLAKTHKDNIFHNDKSGKGFPMKRLTTLAMAAGLFTAKDYAEFKKVGATPEMDLEGKLPGRVVMVELEEVKDENNPAKTYINIANIGLSIFHMKDPRVKDWPKNQNIYNQTAALVGDWVTETTQPPKRETVAAGVADDPFAGKI